MFSAAAARPRRPCRVCKSTASTRNCRPRRCQVPGRMAPRLRTRQGEGPRRTQSLRMAAERGASLRPRPSCPRQTAAPGTRSTGAATGAGRTVGAILHNAAMDLGDVATEQNEAQMWEEARPSRRGFSPPARQLDFAPSEIPSCRRSSDAFSLVGGPSTSPESWQSWPDRPLVVMFYSPNITPGGPQPLAAPSPGRPT
jgi:hypothetical protein